jgi:hypothetical protein
VLISAIMSRFAVIVVTLVVALYFAEVSSGRDLGVRRAYNLIDGAFSGAFAGGYGAATGVGRSVGGGASGLANGVAGSMSRIGN